MSKHDQTQSNGQQAMENGNGRVQVGLGKGISAFFDIDDITIAFWGSAWTGREVVTVDDRVVSGKRSLRYVTEHHFEHAGIHYKLVYRVKSIMRGEMQIELYREGELVDTDQWAQNRIGIDPKTGKASAWRVIRAIAPYFVLGLIGGSVAAKLIGYLLGG